MKRTQRKSYLRKPKSTLTVSSEEPHRRECICTYHTPNIS